MPTAKHVSAATDAADQAETVALDRITIAREQSALFHTRLALARWSMGGDFPHRNSGEKLPLRADWYAQATRNFQEWTDCGGFAQHDEDAPEDAPENAPTLCDAVIPYPGPPVDDGAERTGACID